MSQFIFVDRPSPNTSAAAAASPAAAEPVRLPPAITQPTPAQKYSLAAVPASGASGARRGKKMKNGKSVQKMFNPVAGRPYPSNGISTEQGIRVEMIATPSAFTTSTIANSYTAVYLTLSALGGYASYAGLFDQYRIDQIEFWAEPTQINDTVPVGYFATCIDYDDATAPTTFNQVVDRQGALLSGGSSGHYHKFQPHMAVAAYSGSFSSYANEPANWIDAASPNVQHYGLKVAAFPTAVARTFLLTIRAVVSFRAPGIN